MDTLSTRRAAHRRQALTDRAVLLKMELARTPRRNVGDSLWQQRARKLLAYLTKLQRLEHRGMFSHLLEEAKQHPVA